MIHCVWAHAINEFVVENHSRCYSAILLSLFIFGNVNFASQIFRNSWYTKTVSRYPVYQTQSIIINIRRSQRTLNIVQSRAFHTNTQIHTNTCAIQSQRNGVYFVHLIDGTANEWKALCLLSLGKIVPHKSWWYIERIHIFRHKYAKMRTHHRAEVCLL